ncbi:hypothetical protein JCM16358_22280 [Halanaerocella petrolearia]
MIKKLRDQFKTLATREEGFTLIELMIVIAVIGTLAGIAIPQFGGVRDKADIAAVKSDLRNIQAGLEMYNAEEGEYPASLSDINDYITNVDTNKYSTGSGYSTSGSSYTIEYEVDVDINDDDTVNNNDKITVTPGGISE